MSNLEQTRTAKIKLGCNMLFHKNLDTFQQHLMTEAPFRELIEKG
jgi:hypothetical protein